MNDLDDISRGVIGALLAVIVLALIALAASIGVGRGYKSDCDKYGKTTLSGEVYICRSEISS